MKMKKSRIQEKLRGSLSIFACLIIMMTAFTSVQAAVSDQTGESTALDTVSAAPEEVKSEDAEEAIPAEAVVLEDYQDLSRILFDKEEEDCFGSMTVTGKTGQIIKDGQKSTLSREFDSSLKEAKEAAGSEEDLTSFLSEYDQDTIYEVEKEENGDYQITAPYQTRRLIIDQPTGNDTLGASRVYYNQQDQETILEFETDQETRTAYEQACRSYGSNHCFVDEILWCGDILKSEETVQMPAPGACISWGNRYMGMNALKTQAPVLGYNKEVKVAVIDSGVNKSNPLFSGGRILSSSWDFTAGSSSIKDPIGHGSHVAGIIADATPSNVRIMALRVTDSEGRSPLYALKSAMRYAVNKRVDVINLSMGVLEKKRKLTYMDDIIRKAYYLGIPICVAAGNDGDSVKNTYPANNKYPITVTAINKDLTRGSVTIAGMKLYYANYGSTIDFAAPGTSVISAGKGGNYYYMTGTSQAAPHVTAAVAYLKMIQPDLSVASVEKQLRSMSVDLGKKGKDSSFGYGCPKMTNLFRQGLSYTGKVKAVVGQAKIKKVKNVKKGVQISWNKVGKADQYKVYRRTSSGSYKKLAVLSGSKRLYLDTHVTKGKKYTYAIRACRYGIDGKTSDDGKILRLSPVSGIKAKRQGRSSLKLSWRKGKKVSGYQICYGTSSSMKKKKLVITDRTTKELKGLKGRYIYYQVRAFYSDGSKNWYSAWSDKKRIRLR